MTALKRKWTIASTLEFLGKCSKGKIEDHCRAEFKTLEPANQGLQNCQASVLVLERNYVKHWPSGAGLDTPGLISDITHSEHFWAGKTGDSSGVQSCSCRASV